MAKWKPNGSIECHNDLCKAKGNCKNYKGPHPEGTILKTGRVVRDSCRVYDAKEKAYVSKSKRF